MKYLYSIPLIAILSTQLTARENPFEPTDTYTQKQQEYFKQEQAEKQAKQKELEQIKLEEERMAQKEKELAQLEEQKKLELEKIEEMKKLEEAKKIAKIQKMKTYQVLPFVVIQTSDQELIIHIDRKFQLINQDILKKQNKFLFDFKGNTSFYTIRKTLEHQYFKSYAVGTHRKEGFFRVVIDLEDEIKNYQEDIDTEKGIITIKFLSSK